MHGKTSYLSHAQRLTVAPDFLLQFGKPGFKFLAEFLVFYLVFGIAPTQLIQFGFVLFRQFAAILLMCQHLLLEISSDLSITLVGHIQRFTVVRQIEHYFPHAGVHRQLAVFLVQNYRFFLQTQKIGFVDQLLGKIIAVFLFDFKDFFAPVLLFAPIADIIVRPLPQAVSVKAKIGNAKYFNIICSLSIC